MTTAIQTIITALDEVFAPMDLEVLENSKVWAEGRMAAVAAFKASDEAKALLAARDSWGYYGRVFSIAGGKSWYQMLNGLNAEGRAKAVAKNCANVVAKRNAAIASKLLKAGVSEVISSTFARTKDGFDGTFTVMTDAGKKVVTVNTIRAGGYNIQCLHLRVLTKVR